MSIKTTWTVSLPFKIRKERSHYISWCYPLDVSSQGKTPEEAIKNLKEALHLFLASCLERGTLDRVLKDCGFVHIPRGSRKYASAKKADDPEISIPLPFMIDEQLAKCHG
ncbi:MAG: type II toxin-antitoxin system HicB family antitoxin [Acidobacteriota bacterium]|nr:type II toxin-antitoxin system HicB family antitoxin [Acidobacteriota bacterium]